MNNTLPGEKVSIRQGNAMDLSFCEDETYDVTLLLGPMYHLFTEAEQKQALAEAIRVTKKGGVIFAAYCGNDATMVQYCFGRGMLREERYKKLVDPVTFKASSDPAELFQLYRKEDIDALMDGGVDLLLVETVFDTLNAKAAFAASTLSPATTFFKVAIALSRRAASLLPPAL